MTQMGLRDVELVGHRYRGHCRPGAEAGSQSGTQVPRPMWDRGAETSQTDFRVLLHICCTPKQSYKNPWAETPSDLHL